MPKKFSNAEIVEFLETVPMMSLAMTEDDQPISSLVLFHADKDLTIFFVTLKSSKEVSILNKNKKVGASVFGFKEMLVQFTGVVKQITSPIEVEDSLNKIAESAGNIKDYWPPILQIRDQDYVIYKVVPKTLHVLDLSSKKILEVGELYSEVKV